MNRSIYESFFRRRVIPGPVGGRFGVTEKRSDREADFGTVYGNLGSIWQEVLDMDRSQFRENQTWFDAENKDRSKLIFFGKGGTLPISGGLCHPLLRRA